MESMSDKGSFMKRFASFFKKENKKEKGTTGENDHQSLEHSSSARQ